MTRRLRECCVLLAMALLLPVSGWGQQGDPDRGEALFVGTVAFSAGGAPCLACHGIAGHELGYAAGASYGPDLTAMYENFGEEGLAEVLGDPSVFDSMAAIFTDRPLSEEEIADLTAFFASVAGEEPVAVGAGLAGRAIIGTVILMVIFGAFGWRRLKGVRRPLVEQARLGKGGTA